MGNEEEEGDDDEAAAAAAVGRGAWCGWVVCTWRLLKGVEEGRWASAEAAGEAAAHTMMIDVLRLTWAAALAETAPQVELRGVDDDRHRSN